MIQQIILETLLWLVTLGVLVIGPYIFIKKVFGPLKSKPKNVDESHDFDKQELTSRSNKELANLATRSTW